MNLPALIAPAKSANAIALGGETQVQLADGRLSAYLAFVDVKRRCRAARYALRIQNVCPAPAIARIVMLDDWYTPVGAALAEIHVDAFTTHDEILLLPYNRYSPYAFVGAEIAYGEKRMSVTAPAPPRPRRWWPALTAAACIPCLVAAAAVQWSIPRVVGVQAPAKALAGSLVTIPVQVNRPGSVAYDAVTRDGVQLASGMDYKSTQIHLRIPPNGEGAPYTLHVHVTNSLGTANEVRVIALAAPPPVRAAAPTPAPAPLPSPSPTATPTATPAPAVASSQTRTEAPQINISPQVVAAGDEAVVRVSGVRGDVRVSLMTAGGDTLEQGDADDGEGGVSLTAPNVQSVTTYYVVAAFTDGLAQQTIVKRLVVTPR